MPRILLVGSVALLLVGGIGYYAWVEPTRYAVEIGSAMLAKQMCSCLHVASRSREDCRADQFPSMDPIQLELDGARVRAFVPLLGDRVAVHRPGFGCSLE